MKKLAGVLLAAALSPLAQAENIVALRSSFDLISFDSATPGKVTGRVSLKGFHQYFVPITLDYRPSATGGKLYIIAASLETEQKCRLYTVTTATGAVTAVGEDPFTCATVPTDMDYDPRADAFRVVSGTGNYRVYMNGTASSPDTDVTYASAAGTPDIIGLAYSDNVSPAPGTRTLYAIDSTSDSLVTIGDANDAGSSAATGVVNVIGALGVQFNPVNLPDEDNETASGQGIAAILDVSGATSTAYMFRYKTTAPQRGELYTINLGTGAATLVGQIGPTANDLLGMTVAPGISLPDGEEESAGGAAGAGLLLGLAALGLWRRKRHAA